MSGRDGRPFTPSKIRTINMGMRRWSRGDTRAGKDGGGFAEVRGACSEIAKSVPNFGSWKAKQAPKRLF